MVLRIHRYKIYMIQHQPRRRRRVRVGADGSDVPIIEVCPEAIAFRYEGSGEDLGEGWGM